ncbi:hypothetical protein KIPB_016912, partial [Kipferlia bialata]|eukprot:g16912.t1
MGANSYEHIVRVVGGKKCSTPLAVVVCLENFMFL